MTYRKGSKSMRERKAKASLLAVIMVVFGVMAFSKTTYATPTEVPVEDGIIYVQDAVNYKMSDYWTAENKTAPIKEGYVFGGWYTHENDDYQALRNPDAANDDAWAKFVPAYVMSIKAQVQANTNADSTSTYVRVITTTDSTAYEEIGFDIWYNNSIHETESTVITKVYSALKKTVNDEEITSYPNDEFGTASHYFAVLKIADIYKVNFQKIIYVRPYWTTLDGTKVEGLARYIHVSDSYNGYVSVPINLQGSEAIAAGTVTMTYDATLEPITTSPVEAGRILKEISYHVDAENNQIIFAANSESTTDNDLADGIMGSVRFQVKAGESAKSSYEFVVGNESFANWNEEFVTAFAENYHF